MAESLAVRTRRKTVRIPRSNSHDSMDPKVPPPCARTARTRCQCSLSARVVTLPAVRSECPFRYFVAECITRSAPRSSGCVSTGVAAVESTANRAPAACAISAVAAMSVIVHSGFAGVSTQTSLVDPARIAA